MEVAIVKISSKGQIVIPKEMRKNLKKGDKLMLVKEKDRLVLKKIDSGKLREDIEFAASTEKAYQRYLRGKFKSMDAEEFLRKLSKW